MKILSIITFLLMTFIGFSQTLPEDFEASIITSDFTDFDGGVATVLPNAQSSGINTSATVGQIVRTGGLPWSGSKYILAGNLDFSTMTNITMKVYTAAPIGTVVKFKLEGGVGSAEADALTTVTGAWEEITWNFSGTANTFNTIVLMFDFGNVGDGTATSTFLFDDIEQSVPPLMQIDLPVTFESATVDYTMTDFGDNMSTLLVDPTLPTNMVMQVVKPLSAPTWAGTTISTSLGFANAIPFTLAETEMSVRVWSPDAGIPVRLKVEDHTDPTITCETEVLTTIAGQWETLVFDFANEAAGTAVINIANTYNKASIFFNFDTDGATAGSKTYYFDDVIFSAPPSTDLVITTEVCGNTGGSEVRMTGPFWGWDPTAGPTAVDNMDGTYTFTLSPAPTADMEYLLILDGTQEDMVAAGTASGDWSCTPVTDNFSYANRQWLMTDPLVVSGLAYSQCGPCSAPPSTDLVITTEVCGNTGGSEVRMTGPLWGWDPAAGPIAVDNMDGTYTITLSPAPVADMEYLLILDGVQENLIQDMVDGGNCAPVTDFFGYANRKWLTSDPLVIDAVYDRCVPCSYPDISITTELCDTVGVSKVKMIRPPLWDWNNAKEGVSNGDGTWTFTYSPAPTDSLEYLIVVDQIAEDLVQEMIDGATCAPLTDYSSYANRLWELADGPSVSNTYNTCLDCNGTNSISELSLEFQIYPNPATNNITIKNAPESYEYSIYNSIGSLMLKGFNTSVVDISSLTNGIYLMVINSDDSKNQISFVKN